MVNQRARAFGIPWRGMCPICRLWCCELHFNQMRYWLSYPRYYVSGSRCSTERKVENRRLPDNDGVEGGGVCVCVWRGECGWKILRQDASSTRKAYFSSTTSKNQKFIWVAIEMPTRIILYVTYKLNINSESFIAIHIYVLAHNEYNVNGFTAQRPVGPELFIKTVGRLLLDAAHGVW